MDTIILGFDVSSTTIGWGAISLSDSGKVILIDCGFIKPIKNENILTRIINTRQKILSIITKINPQFIGIENIISFMGGRSSANTIITLATFNRAVGIIAYDYLNKSPELFNVMSIRHGIKLTKKLPSKEEIPDIVAYHLNIEFPYVYDKKNKKKVENFDIADGIAVALYYSFILSGKIKAKAIYK